MKAENGFEELGLDISNWHRARKDFVTHRKHPLATRPCGKKMQINCMKAYFSRLLSPNQCHENGFPALRTGFTDKKF